MTFCANFSPETKVPILVVAKCFKITPNLFIRARIHTTIQFQTSSSPLIRQRKSLQVEHDRGHEWSQLIADNRFEYFVQLLFKL